MIKFIKAPIFGVELENIPVTGEGNKYYVQYLGGIKAGFPSPAEDFLSDRVSLDERYLAKTESTFLNKVRSLSMFPEYQIGDIIIVRADYEPQNLDDVVVSVNNSEYTLKRFNKDKGMLEALNSEYSNSVKIDEGDEVIILGVVDALIREKKKRR